MSKIARAVTHIIHPAWHVNFNLSLQSFERTHIVGVWNLINLALLSHRRTRPRFIFLSSVASVARYSGPSGVPEETFNNPQVARTGYGMSKYAAERILDRAVIGAGLNAVVIRLGQLWCVLSSRSRAVLSCSSSGATIGTGAWSPSEYIPIILRSSQLLGSIPSDLPVGVLRFYRYFGLHESATGSTVASGRHCIQSSYLAFLQLFRDGACILPC